MQPLGARPLPPPHTQAMPTPEPGVRPSRALPYEFIFTDAVSPAAPPTVAVTIRATGAAAGAFQQHNWALPALAPRRYAVTPGAAITDVFNASAFNASAYALAVHGPNGWVRALGGDLAAAAAPGAPAPSLSVAYNSPAVGTMTLTLSNGAGAAGAVSFAVRDEAYGLPGSPWTVGPVAPGAAANLSIPLGSAGWWYDLTVETGAGAPAGLFWRRIMGRMETGAPSTSDPAYGSAAPTLNRWVPPATHPGGAALSLSSASASACHKHRSPLPTAELPAGLVQPPRWSPDASRAARESRRPSKDAGARLFDDEL